MFFDLAAMNKRILSIARFSFLIIKSILLIGILVIILHTASCSDARKAFYDNIKRITVLFVIDSRNDQSIEFVKSFLSKAVAARALPDIKLIFSNRDVPNISSNIPYSILNNDLIRTLPLKNNEFYLYGANRNLILEGSLFEDSDKLIQVINETYSLKDESERRELIRAESTNGFIDIAKNPINLLQKSLNCFAFFEEICEGCASGQVLIRMEQFKDKFPNCAFWFIALLSYNDKDQDRIMANMDIRSNSIVSRSDITSWWQIQKQKVIGKHPVLGTFIVVNRQGTIRYYCSSMKTLEKWLEENSD
jgi:hypothetical protein